MTCRNVSRDSYAKGSDRPLSYPLHDANTPGVVSARVGNHHNIPNPLRPGEDGFCEQMDEVVDVRVDVTNGVWPGDFLERHFGPFQQYLSEGAVFDGYDIPEPIADAGVTVDDPQAAALLVQMDWPTDLGRFIYQYLRREGVPIRNYDESDFVNAMPGFEANLSAHLHKVFELIFQAKWYFGCVRPEEYFGIDGCVFTEYPEGCPKHAAYPAGHGGAAGAVWAFITHFFDFTDHRAQLDVVIKAVYHFAMYRTFAGVHTAADNIEGIRFGYCQDVHKITQGTR